MKKIPKSVLIVIYTKNKDVLLLKKINDKDMWQSVTGSMQENETAFDAAKRELFEETSIKNIKIIREIKQMYEYELPKNLIGIIWKGKFRGQKQKWFIVRFTGSEDEINLNTKCPEFIKWKWIDTEMLPNVIVKFKKDLYLSLLKEIKLVIS